MLEKLKSNKLVLYGGAIIALIGVFIILRNATGGGSSTVVATSTQPTDAQVAAQTNLALAQIQAQTQQNSDASAFAIQSLQVQAGLTEATMTADLQKYAIQQDAANTQLQVTTAAQSQNYQADLAAKVAQETLNQQEQIQASNNAFQLDYATAANSSAIAMANIQASLVNNQIQANKDTTIASLESQAAQLASYLGAQVSINDSNNSKDVTEAQINANVTKYTQGSGNVKGILGAIGGIFSDRRLKTDIVLIGREPDGLGVYRYRYKGDTINTIGFMADEVRKLRPWAMGAKVAGFDTVVYQAA